MCIYEYTVTAKFLAIYSYSKLPAVVREEYIFSRGKEMIFPNISKICPIFMAAYLISKCEDEVWRRSGDIFPFRGRGS